ncbi:MAG: hypothetical protein EA369_01180 [Bradymonadales bacterium]|nr:MAG: hypothetical protein EA369_01180 [Bradymonadales bacterium]
MIFSRLSLVLCLAFSIPIVGSLFTKNGFWELRQLKRQMSETQVHIRQIEASNQELRRKVDLFRQSHPSAEEFRFREELGLVRANEIIYIETSSENYFR